MGDGKCDYRFLKGFWGEAMYHPTEYLTFDHNRELAATLIYIIFC